MALGHLLSEARRPELPAHRLKLVISYSPYYLVQGQPMIYMLVSLDSVDHRFYEKDTRVISELASQTDL